MITIDLSPNFQKEAKKLTKRYPSLKIELGILFSELEKKPDMGTPMGDGVFKIRLAIASKGRGKSGGARVMTYYKIEKTALLIFSIYSKGEKNNISDAEIQLLLKEYR